MESRRCPFLPWVLVSSSLDGPTSQVCCDDKSKKISVGGAHPAQWGDRATVGLGVLGANPMLGIECTLKKMILKRQAVSGAHWDEAGHGHPLPPRRPSCRTGMPCWSPASGTTPASRGGKAHLLPLWEWGRGRTESRASGDTRWACSVLGPADTGWTSLPTRARRQYPKAAGLEPGTGASPRGPAQPSAPSSLSPAGLGRSTVWTPRCRSESPSKVIVLELQAVFRAGTPSPTHVLIKAPQAAGVGKEVAGGWGHSVDPTASHASRGPGAQKPPLGEQVGGQAPRRGGPGCENWPLPTQLPSGPPGAHADPGTDAGGLGGRPLRLG